MNIKRCVKCGKPSRGDAAYCKGCGHHFSVQKPARTPAEISTPPASPHRTGHYSGLHPEDQPYQSSFMAALRPPIPVVLSPSPPSTPSNPHATWVPKSERLASPPDSTAPASHLGHIDDREQAEPDEFILPASPLPLPSPSPLPPPSNPHATWTPKSARQAPAAWARQEQNQVVLPRIATSPIPYPPDRVPAPIAMPEYRRASAPPSLPSDPDLQVFAPRKPKMRARAIPILLTISCLLFLVATSLLAFLFLSKRHEPLTKLTLTATPNKDLRIGDTFTLAGTGFGTDDPISFRRDNNIAILGGSHLTDALGSFSVQITISSSWTPGPHTVHVIDAGQRLAPSTQVTIEAPASPATPPKLQLLQPSNLTIDFGPGDPGFVSTKPITLTNGGGGQVVWQASSDQSWLTVTPNNDKFFGSEVVELMVNRSLQPAQTYSGQVTFTQQGGAARSFTLSVTMSISAPPAPAAFLVLSTPSLSFNAITAQTPPTQTITLQNSGGRPLNWSATTVTGDGAPWLSITRNHGYLDVNATTPVTVSIQSQQLPVGTYTGTISFQGGANPQLALSVSLSIVAPANLTVSTNSLSLQAAPGHTSAGQITIQDSGGQPLDWTVNTTLASGTNWLSVSPTSGSLSPSETQNITVTANAGTLAVNSYQGTLTFSYGGTSPTRQVTVSLAVSLPPMPGISVQPPSLVFNTTQGINPPTQTFTITNSGNAALNWASTEDANGTTYAATSSSGSTTSLAPAKSVTITVTPKVSSAGPGTITALITISDSDKGSTVPQQQISVTINISSAAIIKASPSDMVFNQSSTLTNSEELLTIDNTGSAPLNWSLAQGSQTPASWLSVDTTSGTVAPGSTFTVNVTCDSSQLAVGTYTATLVISDTDSNSPVLPQTVTVTLTVGS